MPWKRMTQPERDELTRLLEKMSWDPDVPIALHSTITRLTMSLKRIIHPASRPRRTHHS